VGAFDRLDVLEGKRVFVFGVDGATGDAVAQDFLDGDCHGGGGLSRADYEQAGDAGKGIERIDDAKVVLFDGQSPVDAVARIGGLEAGGEDLARVSAPQKGVFGKGHGEETGVRSGA
jgi:hypothetical protein